MKITTNRQVRLRRHPVGMPRPTDFEIVDAPIPSPGEGEVLSRTLFLSLDPYMRGRISGVRSYAAGVEIGQVIVGGTVGEVVESRHAAFAPGDIVAGGAGWQAFGIAKAATLRKLDPRQAPVSTALGVLGMPGLTAYVGLLDIGQPKSS
jgi:NADPH-dependent curcumin reductase CurA